MDRILKDALAFLYAASSDGFASSIRTREQSAVFKELQEQDRMLYLFWRCLEAGSAPEQRLLPDRLAAEILLGLKRQSRFRLGACTGNLSSSFPDILCRKDACLAAAVNLLMLLSGGRAECPIEVRLSHEGMQVTMEFELADCCETPPSATSFPFLADTKTLPDSEESRSIRLLLWQRVLRDNGIFNEARKGSTSRLMLRVPCAPTPVVSDPVCQNH